MLSEASEVNGVQSERTLGQLAGRQDLGFVFIQKTRKRARWIAHDRADQIGALHKGQVELFCGFDGLDPVGAQLQPLSLTTGYGDVLGNWCLKTIEEEQSAFLQGGIPRKQAFTLEFVRYGDDLQNR